MGEIIKKRAPTRGTNRAIKPTAKSTKPQSRKKIPLNILDNKVHLPEVYWESYQNSKTEISLKVING